ncbi:MAG: endo-beta-N-acetylglucosaminidase [Oscillospiraceae bacterium]
MDSRKSLRRRIIASLCAAAMVVTMLPANALKAEAKANNHPLPKNSIEPQFPTYDVPDIMDFVAGAREDDPYVTASIPLKDRVQSQRVNDYANTEAQSVALSSMRFTPDSAFSYAFTYWQYLDILATWGPHQGDGIIKTPVPAAVDAAHKNGTKSLGMVFIDHHVSQNQFLAKNSDGTFPVVDKLIEVEQAYGFDGWFYNFEVTLNGNQAATQRAKELLVYHQQVKPEGSVTMWYDDMTNGGQLTYADHFNSNNTDWMKWNGQRTNDYYFTNYNWTVNEVETSRQTALNLGISPYEIFHTLQCQRDGGYLDTYFAGKDHGLFQKGAAKASVGFFVPDVTMNISKTPEDFLMHDNRFWVGYTGIRPNQTPEAPTTTASRSGRASRPI